MSRLLALVVAACLLAGCGSLPNLGGIEMAACEATPGAVCVSAEEAACGWRRLDVGDSRVPGTTNERGDLLMAPPGKCLIAEEYDPNGLLTPPSSEPCEVSTIGVQCVVLMPGEAAATWKRVGAEKGATGLDLADLDSDGACPLRCDF